MLVCVKKLFVLFIYQERYFKICQMLLHFVIFEMPRYISLVFFAPAVGAVNQAEVHSSSSTGFSLVALLNSACHFCHRQEPDYRTIAMCATEACANARMRGITRTGRG